MSMNTGGSKLAMQSDRIADLGRLAVRYSLSAVLIWVGALKFTNYEATGIEMFVQNSPLISWLYEIFSVRTLAVLLGIAEIAAGIAIALHKIVPRVAAAGAAFAIVLFAVTLTFLLSTPGVWENSSGGFPKLSPNPGQFLAKDVMFLAAALWCLGDSLVASRRPHNASSSQTA